MSEMGPDIILIGPAYPYRGGLAAFNERLARALITAGYRVELVTFTLQYPDFLFPGKTQFSDDEPPFDLVIHRKINAINPLNWWSVGRWLRDRDAKVVITAFWLPFMGPCLGTILRVLGNKSHRISLVHNMIPHEKRPGDHWFSRYFTAANDAFMTLSDAVAADVATFSTAPMQTSPHPIYDSYGTVVDKAEARAHLGLSPQGKYLLFFGFIRDYKGLDLLLSAMADSRLANVKLIVAGEYYGNEEKYQTLIRELGVANQLELRTSFISNEEVRFYFGAADAVVQPYKTATQSGISQLAYHFEKPMIVTRVGGLPEIVPHGTAGYVVDVDPTAIADAVVDFYEQEHEAELQQGVRTEKQRFSWDRFVQVLEKLFPHV